MKVVGWTHLYETPIKPQQRLPFRLSLWALPMWAALLLAKWLSGVSNAEDVRLLELQGAIESKKIAARQKPSASRIFRLCQG